MLTNIFRQLVAVLVIGLGFAAAANAQSRHALIIGIDTYDNVPSLQKARQDARAISEVLQARGFQVDLALDTDQLQMVSAFSNFINRIEPGDEAVFFFAGHGVEIEGRNFLLPADVPPATPGQDLLVTSRALAVDQVQTMVQARGARVSLLILDACRDNPFAREGTRSLGATRGLARPTPTEGNFILFSAGTGEAALDRLADTDPNPNSVFTRALLPLMQEPGLDLLSLTQRVRADVRQMARTVGHEQFPAYYDQLAGSFFFTPSEMPLEQSAPKNTSMPATLPAQSNPCDAARADWAVIADTSSTAALTSFIATHEPCALYTTLAQERLQQLSRPAPAPTPQPAANSDICFQLWFERNSIFHRRGMCFQTDRARQYFDISSCTTTNPVLTTAERARVADLQAQERRNGC